MDIVAVKKEIDQDLAIMIDVREQDEWDEGHIDRAYFLPLSNICEGLIPSTIPQNKTIYLYCRKGGRALHAAAILKNFYLTVIPIKEGYEELKLYFQNENLYKSG